MKSAGDNMTKKKPRISQAFLLWLLGLVVVALLATTACLWIYQTRLSEKNALNLLALNIADVYADIVDASDENLLELAHTIAKEVDHAPEITSEYLVALTEKYDVSEINYIGPDGIIHAGTYPDFLEYDMRSGEQSAAFMVLLSGEKEFVQKYQPTSFDASLRRKYGGVVLERGGFIQVGYDAERFHKDIESSVTGITQNRHVGESGCIIISDSDGNIKSDRHGNEGKKLHAAGILPEDLESAVPGEEFVQKVYGETCYCLYREAEGYILIAAMPQREAALSRDAAVKVTTTMQVIVFLTLFVMIYLLVKLQVVDNIHRINEALAEITDGRLETVVNVRSHQEFDALSDDINSTVGTLKDYIAEAAARIDAELAVAKAIQHSALPSVFPPYPDRTDFELWATMHPAKEVGGDFYDFYLLDENHLAVMIADVSGKGIPAAMFMMTAKTLIKGFAESGMSVGEILAHTNDKLCEGNDANMFVTAWIGILDTRTGVVLYGNAGHNPPLVKHGDGSFAYLCSDPELALGALEGMPYSEHKLQLEPGDILYLYTDGVPEATDVGEELYGEDRLLDFLNRHTDSNAQTICDAVKEQVDAFVGDAPQFDDITMLCLRYQPAKGGTRVKEMQIDATVKNIPVVTAFVDEQLEALDCPLSAQVQIDVAIDELFSNIAFYAYNPDVGPATVRVEVIEDPLAVVITFIDHGVPYDPLAKEDPDITLDLDERVVGGLGIYMVKQSMDEVSYEYKNGQNVLTIKKKLEEE